MDNGGEVTLGVGFGVERTWPEVVICSERCGAGALKKKPFTVKAPRRGRGGGQPWRGSSSSKMSIVTTAGVSGEAGSGSARPQREKVFVCPEKDCNRGFSKRWNLSVHMRIHTGVTPFKCRGCGKEFRWRSSLKSHELTHSQEVDGNSELDESKSEQGALSKMRIESLISPQQAPRKDESNADQ